MMKKRHVGAQTPDSYVAYSLSVLLSPFTELVIRLWALVSQIRALLCLHPRDFVIILRKQWGEFRVNRGVNFFFWCYHGTKDGTHLCGWCKKKKNDINWWQDVAPVYFFSAHLTHEWQTSGARKERFAVRSLLDNPNSEGLSESEALIHPPEVSCLTARGVTGSKTNRLIFFLSFTVLMIHWN